MASLVITSQILNAIHAAAVAGYPYETCGLLVGEPRGGEVRVHEMMEAANLNRERPHDRYELDPKVMLKAECEARTKNWAVVGVWHSHPDHPAQPSAADRAEAWEGWSYLIVSVTRTGVAELRCWRLANGTFVEETVRS
jgi:proteasome lid subunit RPN8/RPN11